MIPPSARPLLLPTREIVRFAIVGVLATIVHFLVLRMAVERFGIWAPAANGVAFCLAVVVTYFGQSVWVFRGGRRGAATFARFMITAISGLVANVAIMSAVVDGMGLHYQAGFVTALVVVPASTFVVNKFWVFGGCGAPRHIGRPSVPSPAARQPDATATGTSLILVCLACLAPLLATPVLPLTDFYAHVARYFILAQGEALPRLQENYEAAWRLLPNLGLDVMGTGLMHLFPPLVTARIVGFLIIAAPFLGVLCLTRALHGRVTPLIVLLAGFVAYSHILVWGFANFLLGTGIMLAGLGYWIATADRPGRQLWGSALLGLGLFFVHGLAFAIWGLLLGTVEIMEAHRNGGTGPRALLRRAGRLLLLAAAPVLIFLQTDTAGAKGGVTNSVTNLMGYAAEGRLWPRLHDEVFQRIDAFLRVAESGWTGADWLIGGLLWGTLAAALASGLLRLDHRLKLAAGLVAVLVVAMPTNLFGVGHLDERIPLILLALLSAGLSLAPGAAARARTRLVVLVAALFAVRTVLLTWGWYSDGRVYATYLEVLERHDTGALATAAYFPEGPGPVTFRPNCKPLLSLMLLENATAVPTFANATEQPLRIVGPLAAAIAAGRITIANAEPVEVLLPRLAEAGFDTVVACHEVAPTAVPEGFVQVAAAQPWVIYTVQDAR